MTRLERWVVWSAVALVVGTGVGYGVLRYLLASIDEWGVAAHPLEPLALRLHVLAAPLLVFATGLIAVRHIVVHLHQGIRQGRFSGVAAAATLVPMIASGYGIQVVTDERWRTVLAWTHGATGAVFALGVITHFVVVHVAALRERPATAPARATPEAG